MVRNKDMIEDMFLAEDGTAFERNDLRFIDYDIVNNSFFP